MASAKPFLEAAGKRRCPRCLNGRESWQSSNQPPLACLVQRFSERRRISQIACWNDDPVGWIPSQLLQQLEHDRLLPFEPERIDRVEQMHTELLGGVARQLEARIEIPVHHQRAGAVRDELRQFSERDLS